MRTGRYVVLVALAVVVVCGVTGLIIGKQRGDREVAVRDSKTERGTRLEPASIEVPHVVAPEPEPPGPESVPIPEPSGPPKAAPKTEKLTDQAGAKPPPAGQPFATQPSPVRSSAKEPIQDPLAREALALVGADAEAEAYWYEAINDTRLPPNERQDLIEDLNEDGLSDPKHPTGDDLPLIVSRLMIIEEVWLDAIDEVNANAFQEAYKDLVNLANLARGGGEPVR